MDWTTNTQRLDPTKLEKNIDIHKKTGIQISDLNPKIHINPSFAAGISSSTIISSPTGIENQHILITESVNHLQCGAAQL